MKKHSLRKYLLAGLLVWIPIWATLLVIGFIVDILDKTVALLPYRYQPEHLVGFKIPGLGVVLSVAVVFLTGLLVTNIIGEKLVRLGEAILAKIPFVRTIYNAVKQVLETLFSSNSNAFRSVLLVEYPRKGLWSIAFQTNTSCEQIKKHTNQEMLTIFIPTTPNPTSGFLMMIEAKDAIKLDMTIDEALKLVISLGVMQPGAKSTIITEQ